MCYLVECHGIDIERGKYSFLIGHAWILYIGYLSGEYDAHVTQIHIHCLCSKYVYMLLHVAQPTRRSALLMGEP